MMFELNPGHWVDLGMVCEVYKEQGGTRWYVGVRYAVTHDNYELISSRRWVETEAEADELLARIVALKSPPVVLANPGLPSFVELQAEIERLRALVNQLPHTADGVPMVPGATVWHRGLTLQEVQSSPVVSVSRRGRWDGGPYWVQPVYGDPAPVFSTEERARAWCVSQVEADLEQMKSGEPTA